MPVDLLVEGVVDELVVRAALASCGLDVGTVYGKGGISRLIASAEGISVRGAFGHQVLIVADAMDLPAPCPGEAARNLVATPPHGTIVRLANREIESWILASRPELAAFLKVSATRVPESPDDEADPKRSLINLARRSPRTAIRYAMVPAPGVSATVGTGYVDTIADFLATTWSAASAERSSPSFAKMMLRLRERFS